MQYRTLAMLVISFSTLTSWSQTETSNPFMNDANGKPLYLKSQYVTEGSPFLFDSYCFAEITSMSGTVYKNVLVKLNLVDKSVLYKDQNDEEMVAALPIKRLKFSPIVVSNVAYDETILEGLNGPVNSHDGRVYQVLDSGKMRLLKEIVVTYDDYKKYGEANLTRVFRRKETLYFLSDNGVALQKAPKNNSAVLALFKDKEDLIRLFLNANRLDCRKEKDLIRIFQYRNTL